VRNPWASLTLIAKVFQRYGQQVGQKPTPLVLGNHSEAQNVLEIGSAQANSFACADGDVLIGHFGPLISKR
jgi:hypothetical protein